MILLHFVVYYFVNHSSLIMKKTNLAVLFTPPLPLCPRVLSKIRDELVQMKPLSRTNCSQLFSSSSCSAPSSPSHLAGASTRPGVACPGSTLMSSPAHNCQAGGLKKAVGVGGTTYEISVWAAGPSVRTGGSEITQRFKISPLVGSLTEDSCLQMSTCVCAPQAWTWQKWRL